MKGKIYTFKSNARFMTITKFDSMNDNIRAGKPGESFIVYYDGKTKQAIGVTKSRKIVNMTDVFFNEFVKDRLSISELIRREGNRIKFTYGVRKDGTINFNRYYVDSMASTRKPLSMNTQPKGMLY